METLRVLVVEGDRGAAECVQEDLAAAGHEVVRCHEPGAPAFPCNALSHDRQCPLEASVVDVALDVRRRPRSQPAPQEDGAVCALRHKIPLVVAGPTVLNPYDEYATEVVSATGDVVGACERAATAPLRAHTEHAARVLRRVLDRRAISASPLVVVRRRHGVLLVEVRGAEALDSATKQMASVRITAGLRALDRGARGIDVAFHDR